MAGPRSPSPPASTEDLRSRSPPHARSPRPGRLTLVGLRQRVFPLQVLERLTRPDFSGPLPRPQQKEKEQHPGPIPSRQTPPPPPPPPPPPRGTQSRRHLSHHCPFTKSPPHLTSHWPIELPAPRPIGSHRFSSPAGEHLTDWLAWYQLPCQPRKGAWSSAWTPLFAFVLRSARPAGIGSDFHFSLQAKENLKR